MSSSLPRLLLLAALLLAPACVGAPEPVPIPSPSLQLLRASGATPELIDTPILVVGLPGAVAGAGRVAVERGSARVEARSTASGTFSVQLPARRGDQLSVTFEGSAPTLLEVEAPNSFYGGSPHEVPGVPPVTGPTDGMVTLQGASDQRTVVLGVNLSTGDVTSIPVDGAGRFSLQLPADHGHLLRLYVDELPLGPPWELTVP